MATACMVVGRGSGLLSRERIREGIQGFLSSIYPIGYEPPKEYNMPEIGLVGGVGKVRAKRRMVKPIARAKPKKKRVGLAEIKRRRRKMVKASRKKNRK